MKHIRLLPPIGELSIAILQVLFYNVYTALLFMTDKKLEMATGGCLKGVRDERHVKESLDVISTK